MDDKRLTLLERFSFWAYGRIARHDGGCMETNEVATFLHYGQGHLLPPIVVVPQAGWTHAGRQY